MRKRLSRVHRGLGAITWYLEDDHLLAADQRWFRMYYRRFYFADLRVVQIWPNNHLWRRLGAIAVGTWMVAGLAWELHWHHAGIVLAAAGLAGAAVEAGLGPRASARIETRHSRWEGPLAARWREAESVLAEVARCQAGEGAE